MFEIDCLDFFFKSFFSVFQFFRFSVLIVRIFFKNCFFLQFSIVRFFFVQARRPNPDVCIVVCILCVLCVCVLRFHVDHDRSCETQLWVSLVEFSWTSSVCGLLVVLLFA